MDKFLSYIDLPQSSFNASSTTTYFVPERTFTANNSPTELRAVSTRLSTASSISFVTSTTSQNGPTLTLPAGIQAGDLIYIIAGCGATFDNGVPSGYTSLFFGTFAFSNTSRVYYKTAAGDESGTSINYANSASDTNAAACAVYRGVSAVNFIGFTSADGVTTITSSGFVGALGDLGLVSVVGLANRGATTTGPVGPTKRFESPTGGIVGQSVLAGHYDEAVSQNTIPGGTETDVGGNPAASFTRVRAKFDGTLQRRTSAGVDAQLGGALAAVTFVCPNQAASTTLTNVTGGQFQVPPGKTANVFYVGTAQGTAVTATATGFNFVINQGAGGNALVAYSYKKATLVTASASQSYQGGVFNIAASTSASFGNSASSTTTASCGELAFFKITNNSTTSPTTVQLQKASSVSFLGSGFFVLIS